MDKHAQGQSKLYRSALTELLDALATQQLKPVIAKRIPLAAATKAHELLELGGHTGKVVLTTNAYRSA
jgi:NADPH:quinone reductase-like Zn-dependent oxidoreductase